MNATKIMVVEDEFTVANDLRRSLVRMGYEVSSVSASGEKALERVGQEKPDLALMDIHLRGEMDGMVRDACMKRMRTE